MLSKHIIVAAAVTICASAIGYVTVHSRVQPDASRAPLVPVLHLQGYVESRDGRIDSRVGMTANLADGSYRTLALHADPRTCTLTSGTDITDRRDGSLWTVDARLISATEDELVVDLQWSKRVSSVSGDVVEESQHRQSAAIAYGEPRTLDLEQGSDCGRIFVDLHFRLTQLPSLVDATLKYDMWLVHRNAHGIERADRLLTSARQDTKVEYFFAPLSHGPDTLAGGMGASLETGISGTVRGRAREDGLIDLTFYAMRTVFDERAREPAQHWHKQMWIEGETVRESDSRGALGSGGTKLLTVRPAETVEIALPAVTGRLGSVDLEQALAGHSTVIRLTATRLR